MVALSRAGTGACPLHKVPVETKLNYDRGILLDLTRAV